MYLSVLYSFSILKAHHAALLTEINGLNLIQYNNWVQYRTWPLNITSATTFKLLTSFNADIFIPEQNVARAVKWFVLTEELLMSHQLTVPDFFYKNVPFQTNLKKSNKFPSIFNLPFDSCAKFCSIWRLSFVFLSRLPDLDSFACWAPILFWPKYCLHFAEKSFNHLMVVSFYNQALN